MRNDAFQCIKKETFSKNYKIRYKNYIFKSFKTGNDENIVFSIVFIFERVFFSILFQLFYQT